MDKCITKPEKSPGHTEYDYRLLEDNYYMEDDKSPFTPENTLRPGVKVVIVDASPADLPTGLNTNVTLSSNTHWLRFGSHTSGSHIQSG
ncbi:hypothetical protein Pcinc_021431 [Petrolisthes cinctipes]|uniref:Uncharacterized protein n=1 Tax=Petrolisthes cinctipes TaxID=88211 RepID=A0AAE1FFZ9_PETCI|nr:hypothetical protein Pcinc_021431 [Petrolisthes cinctipes]